MRAVHHSETGALHTLIVMMDWWDVSSLRGDWKIMGRGLSCALEENDVVCLFCPANTTLRTYGLCL